MECHEVQRQLLELLDEAGFRTEAQEALTVHLAGCGACRSFVDTQLQLDRQLSAAFPALTLSPAFRDAVRKGADREPHPMRLEYLPALAHAIGCACAIALSIWMLPFPAVQVLLAGVAVALTTYLLQSVLGSLLEEWEDDRYGL